MNIQQAGFRGEEEEAGWSGGGIHPSILVFHRAF